MDERDKNPRANKPPGRTLEVQVSVCIGLSYDGRTSAIAAILHVERYIGSADPIV
jgi:hypothetical protein